MLLYLFVPAAQGPSLILPAIWVSFLAAALVYLQSWLARIAIIIVWAGIGEVFQQIRVTRAEVTRLKSELTRVSDELKLGNASIGSIAHELRNPIHSLLACLALLNTMRLDVKPEAQECLETARCCGEILVSLIGSLIDSAKLGQNSRLDLNNSFHNVRQAISALLNLIQVQAKIKNIVITCESANCLPDFIWLDLSRFNQIMLNLLGNAAKFTPAQGNIYVYVDYVSESPIDNENDVESFLYVAEELRGLLPNSRVPSDGHVLIKKVQTLKTFESMQKGFLKIHVIDTGIGMTEAESRRLFAPFQQANDKIKSRYGGSGLGLWISNKIVEAMRGRLVIHSRERIGSEFVLVIPTHVGYQGGRSPIAYTPNTLRRSLTEINDYLRGKRILMVMSQVSAQFEAKHLFESFGVSVDLANSAYTALKKRREQKNSYYHLCLIDLSMEMYEGFKTYNSVRNDETVRGGRPSFVILLDRHGVIKEDNCQGEGSTTDEIKLRILADMRQRTCIKVRENLSDKLLTEISYQIKSNFLPKSKAARAFASRYHLLPEQSALYPSTATSRRDVHEGNQRNMKRIPSSPHIGRDSRSPLQSNAMLILNQRYSESSHPVLESSAGSDEGDRNRKMSMMIQSQKNVIDEEKIEDEKNEDICDLPPSNPSPLSRKNSKGGQIQQRLLNFEGFARMSNDTSPRKDITPFSTSTFNKGLDQVQEVKSSELEKSLSSEQRPIFHIKVSPPKIAEEVKEDPVVETNEEIVVLIVDDDSFSAMMMERFIKGRGNWKHRLAMNGDEAVDEIVANYERYHCIIMDCEMPGKDGYEATRDIRAFELARKSSAARIPIFGVSGHEQPEDREKALNAGMTKYFTKPVDFPTFLGELYENATSYKIMRKFK